MKSELTEEKNNALFERREITLLLSEFTSTPSRKQVIEEAVKLTASSPEQIIVEKISQRFGAKQAKAFVRVYSSKEALEKFEPLYKRQRGVGKPKEASPASQTQ